MKINYKKFKNLYSLNKTLKFSLIPVGETQKFINENNLLEQDEIRLNESKTVQGLMDEYYRKYLNNRLSNFRLENLESYCENHIMLVNKKDKEEKDIKDHELESKKYRKTIGDLFKVNELCGKEVISTKMLDYFKEDLEKTEIIKKFVKSTTYFTGFWENRKNVFSGDEKSTSIAHRIIDVNLPLFINNINLFNKFNKICDLEYINEINSNFKNILEVAKIDEIFEPKYFNYCLTQKGIQNYNLIIDGYTTDDKKVKGLNEYINEHNQRNTKDKHVKKLAKLNKQILSEETTFSYIIDKFESDQELINCVNEFYLNINDKFYTKLQTLLRNINNYDLNKIYLRNDLSLTNISNKLFDDWSTIKRALENMYDIKYEGKKKINTDGYLKERTKYFKNNKVFSIQYINDCLEGLDKNTKVNKYFTICDELINEINNNYSVCYPILNNEYSINKKLIKEATTVSYLKELLDTTKELQLFIKPLLIGIKELNTDIEFYENLQDIYDILKDIIPLYDKVRNYVTQKPYSIDKYKLNFNCSTLLDGWDVNKVSSNLGTILIKDNEYYLGILNNANRNIFNKFYKNIDCNTYKKVEYKLLPGPNKMLPKVFFSKSRINEFNPTEELLNNYKMGKHIKGENFDINFCHQLIDFYKDSITKHEEWKNFNFKFSDTKKYKDIGEFYNDVRKRRLHYKLYRYTRKLYTTNE